MSRAERLIQTLTTDPKGADEGVLANDLLREFHRGFPIARLRPLLESKNATVVRVASFIVDELGSKAAPLLDSVAELLIYRDRHVRGNAIGSILTCSTGKNARQIAAVISLLNDADWPIRWKVMEFMSLASSEQLQAALRHFESTEPNSDHVSALHWLNSDGAANVEQVAARLACNSELERKYGVVAAARMASVNEAPLYLAVSNYDADVKQFANSMLEIRMASR